MGAFRAMDGRAVGSRPTSSASPTAYSLSTGKSCKTKQPGKNRKACCRCLVQNFLRRRLKRTQPDSIGKLQFSNGSQEGTPDDRVAAQIRDSEVAILNRTSATRFAILPWL